MEGKNEKLDFNFDFLGEDKNPIEEQKERVEKIIKKIDEIIKIADTVTSAQIDVLIVDIGIASEKLSNNSFYDEIFLAIIDCTLKLNHHKKHQEALMLLKYVYNLPKSNNNQIRCKEFIDSTIKLVAKQNGEKIKTPYHSRFFSSKKEEKNDENKKTSKKNEDNFGKTILWICIIVIAIVLLSVGIHIQKQNNYLSSLEEECYTYYKICNGATITSDSQTDYEHLIQENCIKIAKIKKAKPGDIEDELYDKFGRRFNDEKAVAISELASAYNYDKSKFDNLKEKYLPIFFRDNIDNLNQAVDAKLGYKELSLVPEPLPRGGLLMNYTGRQPIAPFQITTGNMHCYIKMYDAQTNELALTIFAPANQTTELEVPLGNYIVKSARGYKWYGVNDLFGHNTVCKQAETNMDFHIEGNYVVGKTLRLYETRDGNLHSTTINANEF